jgi:phage shock protein A
MGILRRTTDILAANVNDFVDRFEQPERMLRHALREMEGLIASTSAAVARSIATEKLLAGTQADEAAQVQLWQQRAATAIGLGDEPLARRAIARKLEHQHALSVADRQLATARETNEVLRRQLNMLREKHGSARSRLMIVSARQLAAEAQRQMLSSSLTSGGEARALARFERFYQHLEFAQAEAMALLELESHGESDLQSEFERRATEDAIEEELARLKASQDNAERPA